jgi:hypothetical protein
MYRQDSRKSAHGWKLAWPIGIMSKRPARRVGVFDERFQGKPVK